jgi:ABC-2 type transport system ATP-binding protein
MLKQKVETLSGGMKKRLSIACALSNHASLLIMDEPGAALDLECKQEIRDYLKTYLAEGGSVILTSHELEEFSLCTGMYVLKEGILKKTTTGLTAEELIRQF